MKICHLFILLTLLPATAALNQQPPRPCESLTHVEHQIIFSSLFYDSPKKAHYSEPYQPPSFKGRPSEAKLVECGWHLAAECPDLNKGYDPYQLCEQAKAADGPFYLILNLRESEGNCAFIPKAKVVINQLKSPRARIRWCLAQLSVGGDSKCLYDDQKVFADELHRKLAVDSRGQEIWLSGYFQQFAHPRYKSLLPWLKSLPQTRTNWVVENLRFAIAVQEQNPTALAEIMAKSRGNFSEAMVWLFHINPKIDFVREARRHGAVPERIRQIKELAPRVTKPDTLKAVLEPTDKRCETSRN